MCNVGGFFLNFTNLEPHSFFLKSGSNVLCDTAFIASITSGGDSLVQYNTKNWSSASLPVHRGVPVETFMWGRTFFSNILSLRAYRTGATLKITVV